MSLGVLNNLSAVYAENNLNNSNSSLNTVLQQLSSGSKINSGADDAAGLSLVDGLQANQQALTQSETNATEGVGLLQVADGALSQVTSLLNRAVTLATEASNGTLNSSQDTAANQEYQSILSEISNIGTTTTYNDAAVFNTNTNIYTGDASTAGSSVDALDIRSLSSSNVGDSGGVMAYSNGANNVFLNMSSSTANAQTTDSLGGSSNTMAVTYLVKGSDGSESTANTSITVGGSSGFANTVGGMISAINNSGLGLTATFATQAQAGVQGGGTQTGIEITGGLISAGYDPNASSTSGTLDLTGLAANATLALGAQVTVTQGANSHVFTINSSNNTLGNLATAITGTTGLGVTANVITNGDGTQSLSLADNAGGGALSVTTTAGTAQVPAFAGSVGGSTVAVQAAGSSVNGNAFAASNASTITVGTAAGGEAATDQLTEGTSITLRNSIANDNQVMTFVVGNGSDNTPAGTYYTGNADGGGGAGGNTLGNLADTINAQSSTLGVYATVGANGLTITTGSYVSGTAAAGNIVGTNTMLTGQNVYVESSTLTSANTGASGTKLGLYTPTIGGQAGGGSPTITALDDGHAASETDVLAGTFTLSDAASGGPVSFVMSGTNTWGTLLQDINNSSLGVSASWNAAEGGAGKGGLELTAESNGVNPVTLVNVGGGITDGANAIVDDAGGVGVQAGAAGNVDATASTAILQLSALSGTTMTDTGGGASTLGGAVSISYNGATQVFIMGSAPSSGAVNNAIYTGGTSVTSLIQAINASAMGGVTNALYAQDVVATDNAAGGGTGGIYLQGATGVASPFTLNTINPVGGIETPLAVTSGIYVNGNSANTLPYEGSTAATGAAGNNAVDNVIANNSAVVSTSDTMAGHITVVNGNVTDTFNVGTGSDTYNTSNHTGTFYTNNTNTTVGTGLPGALENYGNTLEGLAAAISAESSTLGVTAQANSSGLTFTQTGGTGTYTGGNITTNTNNLTDVTEGTYATNTTNELANENDTLSGGLVFNVGAGGTTQTVTMAQVATANSNENVSAVTAKQLISFINQNSTSGLNLGISAAWVPSSGNSSFGSIQLTSGTEGAAGAVNVSSTLTDLTDTTTGAALTYTSKSAYNMGLSGSIADTTSGQTAATFSSDSKASSGAATISYTDAAGQSLSATDLTNQANAEGALTSLNSAITDVAAQDGYIGAQINTLNAVSQVLSTQQENVESAQNAVQATDYASATSNMSKYEILSQTGIAALAQANSIQQEVTKLLQ
jgi:flagellin